MIYLLCIVIFFLVIYIFITQSQIKSINKQLIKRLNNNSNALISLELINKRLNKLAVNINKCLKKEEYIRLKNIREENQFKEMIANISHDLRTPLTVIKGYQQLLEKEELTKDQKEKIKVAQVHANELGELIEHFFEYSYLLNSEPKINIERINLTNLIMDIIMGYITLLEEKNLRISFNDSNIKFIFADKEMITRIIQNLLRNCVQHAMGDIIIEIEEKDNYEILFRNKIDKNSNIDASKLFERFYTGDKARRSNTGLGLSIVKLLSEQLGGKVEASINNYILDIKIKLPINKI